jgi:hypothetical protein
MAMPALPCCLRSLLQAEYVRAGILHGTVHTQAQAGDMMDTVHCAGGRPARAGRRAQSPRRTLLLTAPSCSYTL